MKVEFLHTRLSMKARFIIAFLFYFLVALLQVLIVRGENLPVTALRFAGFGLLAIPLWFLKTKNFSSKPAKKKALKKADKESGKWLPVSLTEVDRLLDKTRSLGKVKIPFVFSPNFGRLFTFLFIFLFLLLAVIADNAVGLFILVDLYLIFFPVFFFARVEKKLPDIAGRINAFAPVLKTALPKKLKLSSLFFFEQNDDLPADIRLMLEPSSTVPQEVKMELLGAQLQLTFNNGPNGEVPYIYAVFITKGKGKIWQSFSNIKAPSYITEAGSSTEGDTVYGTVVLRLDTKSRSDGYHTRENDVKKLLGLVVQAMEKVCKGTDY